LNTRPPQLAPARRAGAPFVGPGTPLVATSTQPGRDHGNVVLDKRHIFGPTK
jgi:hypothetical protein